MKRLLSSAAMLLVCCVTLFAQQALWGGAAVVSPDIHDDNTVTFRLKAPKAVRVQITGDFLPPQTTVLYEAVPYAHHLPQPHT